MDAVGRKLVARCVHFVHSTVELLLRSRSTTAAARIRLFIGCYMLLRYVIDMQSSCFILFPNIFFIDRKKLLYSSEKVLVDRKKMDKSREKVLLIYQKQMRDGWIKV